MYLDFALKHLVFAFLGALPLVATWKNHGTSSLEVQYPVLLMYP